MRRSLTGYFLLVVLKVLVQGTTLGSLDKAKPVEREREKVRLV